MRLIPSIGALALLVLWGCGSSHDAAAAPAGDAAAAPAGETATAPWPTVEADAYDTLVGSGFRADAFVRQWGGFDDTGHHRPDAGALSAAELERPLTAEERAGLHRVLDEHEPGIRAMAAVAYDTLRVALDATWTSGAYLRTVRGADDEVARAARAAMEEASSAGGFTYCDAFTTGGWQVQVVVNSLDHPEFHGAFAELQRAVAAREADARRYLSGVADRDRADDGRS